MAGKAKDTSGTCRTFPIKQGHWLYQFHGGKVVGYQHRAFIDFKMQGFPPYAKPAALLSCGLPKLYVSQMVLEIHCSQVENSFGILEREVWRGLWFFALTLSILLWGWCFDMKLVLQGPVGADPDGRASFKVERPVPFHIGKHQPTMFLESIYLCTG